MNKTKTMKFDEKQICLKSSTPVELYWSNADEGEVNKHKCKQCAQTFQVMRFSKKYTKILQKSKLASYVYEQFAEEVKNWYDYYSRNYTYDSCTCGFAYTKIRKDKTGYTYLHDEIQKIILICKPKNELYN